MPINNAVNNNTSYNNYELPAFAAGYAANKIIRGFKAPINNVFINKLVKLNCSVSEPDIDILEKASDKALEMSKVDKKGVKFNRVKDLSSLSKAEKFIADSIDKLKIPSKKIKELLKNQQILTYSAIQGKNAFFNKLTNEITYNKDKMPLPTFHEIGHAMNRYYSKTGNFLQHKKYFSNKYAGMVALLALFAPAKCSQKENNQQSTEDKAIGKFRDYSGLIAAGISVPTVIEEGMASFKGNKLAKQLLNPDLYKKVKKNNLLGFATYATSAIITGLATYAGVELKNTVISKCQQNNKNI